MVTKMVPLFQVDNIAHTVRWVSNPQSGNSVRYRDSFGNDTTTPYPSNILKQWTGTLPRNFQEGDWFRFQSTGTSVNISLSDISHSPAQIPFKLSPGYYYNDVTIILGSIKPDTPTYLETLDKLDQWSTAQYIPNGGNELNL